MQKGSLLSYLVCSLAFLMSKVQVWGMGSSLWGPLLRGLSCPSYSSLLRRTTHVSKSCPLALSGEGLYRSHYCGTKTGCLGLES